MTNMANAVSLPPLHQGHPQGPHAQTTKINLMNMGGFQPNAQMQAQQQQAQFNQAHAQQLYSQQQQQQAQAQQLLQRQQQQRQAMQQQAQHSMSNIWQQQQQQSKQQPQEYRNRQQPQPPQWSNPQQPGQQYVDFHPISPSPGRTAYQQQQQPQMGQPGAQNQWSNSGHNQAQAHYGGFQAHRQPQPQQNQWQHQ